MPIRSIKEGLKAIFLFTLYLLNRATLVSVVWDYNGGDGASGGVPECHKVNHSSGSIQGLDLLVDVGLSSRCGCPPVTKVFFEPNLWPAFL
ncbi:hypothetical protein ZIOFF_000819 [Zingiber officinale]|uniref:Uncharacterized protein n=1 Tax=Zingiber officinale TaxID=94328 RepID=A0A8J5IIQ1_ZINOF|nr:hypothetical protein ZIOFF_000819 [Zingiber officinale]